MDIDSLLDTFPHEVSTQELYDTASRLAAKNRFEEAETIFSFLIQNKDKIPPYFAGASLFKLGEMVRNSKKPAAAEEYFRQCLAYIPHHSRAAAYLGLNREDINQWVHLNTILSNAVEKIHSVPSGDANTFHPESPAGKLWRTISSENNAEKVHGLFLKSFSYPLSPAPNEDEEHYIRSLEENYAQQKNLYLKRLQMLPVPLLKEWITGTAGALNTIIQNNRIVEDTCRNRREFLFWALCVQLEFSGEIILARRIAEYFFRRFLESFIMARQIRHLSLLKSPTALHKKHKSNDLVSIVTPYYNSERYVRETLESIANQTYRNFEWIVVDDGSSEPSTHALKEIIAQYPEIDTRIISSNHVGQAAATNVGIRQARGKYILPLDADDQIAVDYLEKALDQFQEDPTLDVVYFQTVAFGFRNRLMVLTDFDVPSIYCRNLLNICSLVKKEAMDGVNGYNENIAGYEDWNMWISFAQQGMKFKRIREVMFFYRKSFVSRGFRSKDKDYLKRKMIMECHPDIYRMPTKAEEPLLKQSYLYIPPIFLKGTQTK